jgi:hypothetical protein
MLYLSGLGPSVHTARECRELEFVANPIRTLRTAGPRRPWRIAASVADDETDGDGDGGAAVGAGAGALGGVGMMLPSTGLGTEEGSADSAAAPEAEEAGAAAGKNRLICWAKIL